jgi:hypothetical protein
MLQAVGMFDGANGTVRERVASFAVGRENPNGPLASTEHYVVMDEFCGFAWHELTRELVTTGGSGR